MWPKSRSKELVTSAQGAGFAVRNVVKLVSSSVTLVTLYGNVSTVSPSDAQGKQGSQVSLSLAIRAASIVVCNKQEGPVVRLIDEVPLLQSILICVLGGEH